MAEAKKKADPEPEPEVEPEDIPVSERLTDTEAHPGQTASRPEESKPEKG